MYIYSFLLCGDIPSAEMTFKLQSPQTYSENIHAMVDNGLVAVAQNKFEEALDIFQKANEKDKENILVRISSVYYSKIMMFIVFKFRY